MNEVQIKTTVEVAKPSIESVTVTMSSKDFEIVYACLSRATFEDRADFAKIHGLSHDCSGGGPYTAFDNIYQQYKQ